MFWVILSPILLGIVVGIIAAVIFNIYSRRTSTQSAFMLFGIDSKTILTTIGLFLLSTLVVVLTGMAVMMQDWSYVVHYPMRFLIELACATLLPSLLILIMSYFRHNGRPTSRTWMLFGGACVEFGMLHILMQISGIYGILVPNRLPI
jgi:hypothetical protein